MREERERLGVKVKIWGVRQGVTVPSVPQVTTHMLYACPAHRRVIQRSSRCSQLAKLTYKPSKSIDFFNPNLNDLFHPQSTQLSYLVHRRVFNACPLRWLERREWFQREAVTVADYK